ncbi:MAG: diacylglycerol kinase family protein [Anaeromyxobacter sp.]
MHVPPQLMAREPEQASSLARRTPLLASFGHAWRGLVHVAARERNMRLHLLAGVTVGLAGTELPLPGWGRVGVILAVALVIAGEALNSALEALVDLHTRERRPEARLVKDAAAGAVLALAAGAVLLGLPVLAEAWARLPAPARPGPLAMGRDLSIVAAAGALLLPADRPRIADLALTVAGLVLLASAALHSASLPLTAVSALAFAIAAAAAQARRELA